MDRMQLHPLNRHVNPEWVNIMKNAVLGNVINRRYMRLTVGIDVREVHDYIFWSEPGPRPVFKCYILDGQHRWQAMMELQASHPHLQYDVMLDVEIVENDEKFDGLLQILNTCNNFSLQDQQVTSISFTFSKALNCFLPEKNRTARIVMRLKKRFQERLTDKTVVSRLIKMTQKDFEDRLSAIAKPYKKKWSEKKKTNPIILSHVMGQIISYRNLYMFCDESYEWVNDI